MTIPRREAGLLRGVSFDLFGTLIVPDRFEERNVASLLRWATDRGLPAGPDAAQIVAEARAWMWRETYQTGRQYLATEAIARAAGELGWPSDAAFLQEAVNAFFAPEVATVQVYSDAAPALSALRDLGCRVGLISNASDHGLIEGALDRLGLVPFFDPVISSAGFGRIKPDPDIYRFVLDRWALSPGECVMVGDSLDADIEGAQAVGMRAILVTMHPNPNNPRLADRIHPDATAASLTDAAGIIRAWSGTDPPTPPGGRG
ncbi:MAG: HAD family hydrolase [Armatimonadetes bacterium]|nr:HAD family hydrolase [Armatimonadota bacterium]